VADRRYRHGSIVVVIGGGRVGLAAAVDQGLRGRDVLLVDAGDGVAHCPTAESIDARTMGRSVGHRRRGVRGVQR
jgi:thioredoxin reductase